MVPTGLSLGEVRLVNPAGLETSEIDDLTVAEELDWPAEAELDYTGRFGGGVSDEYRHLQVELEQ